jgi:hypothetical protein
MPERFGSPRATALIEAVRLSAAGQEASQALAVAGPDAMAAVEQFSRKNPVDYVHSRRVATIATRMSRENGIPDHLRLHVAVAAWLHDIEKMKSPDAFNYAKYSREEVIETIHAHVQRGVKRISRMDLGDLDMPLILMLVGGHHEHPSPALPIEPYPDAGGANPYATPESVAAGALPQYRSEKQGELILAASDQIDAICDPNRHPHSSLPDMTMLEESIMADLELNPDFAPLPSAVLEAGIHAGIALNRPGGLAAAESFGLRIVADSGSSIPVTGGLKPLTK